MRLVRLLCCFNINTCWYFLRKKPNKDAAPRNRMPTPHIQENDLIAGPMIQFLSSDISAPEPNRAKATINGPIMVPNEFTPPPRFTRVVPVAGSPRVISKRLGSRLLQRESQCNNEKAKQHAGKNACFHSYDHCCSSQCRKQQTINNTFLIPPFPYEVCYLRRRRKRIGTTRRHQYAR